MQFNLSIYNYHNPFIPKGQYWTQLKRVTIQYLLLNSWGYSSKVRKFNLSIDNPQLKYRNPRILKANPSLHGMPFTGWYAIYWCTAPDPTAPDASNPWHKSFHSNWARTAIGYSTQPSILSFSNWARTARLLNPSQQSLNPNGNHEG